MALLVQVQVDIKKRFERHYRYKYQFLTFLLVWDEPNKSHGVGPAWISTGQLHANLTQSLCLSVCVTSFGTSACGALSQA